MKLLLEKWWHYLFLFGASQHFLLSQMIIIKLNKSKIGHFKIKGSPKENMAIKFIEGRLFSHFEGNHPLLCQLKYIFIVLHFMREWYFFIRVTHRILVLTKFVFRITENDPISFFLFKKKVYINNWVYTLSWKYRLSVHLSRGLSNL